MRNILIILITLMVLGCARTKGVCEAYHTGNPNNGKKPYYLR